MWFVAKLTELPAGICGGIQLCKSMLLKILPAFLTICSEAQAFGRAYRMGQLKETYFNRYVVLGSVDARLRKRKHDASTHLTDRY